MFSGVENITVPADQHECTNSALCRFIVRHSKSDLVDAGYSPDMYIKSSGIIDRVSIVKKPMGVRTVQSHKILLHFEVGDDYGRGLAWKLYSRSVLLMHPPTRTTWLMEELLEPWVHFLPLNETNAEDMVRWVVQNDEEAEKISERASLFIHDLFLHPDAMSDEDNIKSEMRRRYQEHWKV